LPFHANFGQSQRGIIFTDPGSMKRDGCGRPQNSLRERIMILHNSFSKKLACTALFLALPLSTAGAFEANAVADRFKAALAGQGTEITWSNLTDNGSQIVLQDTKIKFPGVEAPTDAALIGDVTLDGVADENGGYKIGKVTLPAYRSTIEGLDIDMSGAEVSGLTLPAEGTTDPLASLVMYEKATVASVSVRQGGKDLFSLNDLHFDITPPKDGAPLEFTGAAEKFTANLASADDPKATEVLRAMGYSTLDGKFEMAGSWQPSDGKMNLSQFDLSVGNAGKFGITLDLGGYTPDLAKALQDMQKKMAEQPQGGDKSAQGLAMLGLMQQLTFHGATIRFDDASLTGKVLEYLAGQQGVKPSDVANQAKAIVPFMLTQLNNPELMQSATQAVTKYLDNPQSIEIKAAPASPVPFALVMAGAMSAPQDLTKTLGVTVTANE
jgi:hypothetical protein